jgi:glycosyltransferase involved in cell wall biosynthesis
MPELTIAMPTFNRAHYLQEALVTIQKDAAGQLDRIEVLISDNASRDDTEQVVRTFDELPIRYYRNTSNIGPFENVLCACERSQGAYILLHSDDDLLCPGAIPNLLKCISVMPWVGVIASPLHVFENDFPEQLIGKIRFPGEKENVLLAKGARALSALFMRASSFSGLVIRRNLLDIEEVRKDKRGLYPQIYLIGTAVKKADALYLAQPLMKIRLNPVKYWSYNSDFMAGAVLGILKNLTRNEPWGREVQRKLTKRRIFAAYGALYSARAHSWSSFIRVMRGFASVIEYRRSFLFWSLVFGIGILGPNGITIVRRFWRGPTIDIIKP